MEQNKVKLEIDVIRMRIKETLLLIFGIFIVTMSNINIAHAGCGTHTKYGEVICLDYEGLPTSTAHCNKYASQINAKPAVPTKQCPNECCTETHYDHDGTVLSTTEKIAGTCSDTYADPPPITTPDPDPPPSDPPPEPPPPSDPPPSDPPPSDPPPSDPDPSCSYYSQVIDSKNEVSACPSGQQGQISKWYEKIETRQTDCSKSVSGWQLVQTDNSCKDIPKKGCPSEMVIWSGTGGKSGICSATISSASHGQTRTATKTIGNTGSATYKCNDGNWERQGMGTCVHDHD